MSHTRQILSLAQLFAERARLVNALRPINRHYEVDEIERAFKEGETQWIAAYLSPHEAEVYKTVMESAGFTAVVGPPYQDELEPQITHVRVVLTALEQL